MKQTQLAAVRLSVLVFLGSLVISQTAVVAMTDDVRRMCEQSEQLINARRFNEAIRLLQQAGGMDPNCAEVHGYLGMAYQNSGNTSQAVREYQQALQLGPQMSFLNVNLGNCFLNLNQPDQAVSYFQKYLQENPNAPDAAQVQMSIQQAGSRKGQNDLRSTVERGQSLMNGHRYNEASQAFRQAISIDPNFAPAHFFLGYSLAQSGQPQQAIPEFQTALQLDPTMKQATMNIASNYQSMGDARSAIEWYEKYLQENPGAANAGDIRNRINGLRQQANRQRSPQSAYSSPPQSANSNPPAQSTLSNQGGLSGSDDPYEGMVPPQMAQSQTAPPPGQVGGNELANSGSFSGEASPAGPNDYLDSVASQGHYFRWMPDQMPIRVFIAPGAGAPGYKPSFGKLLADAFSIWAKGSEGRLSFTYVQDPAGANIVCGWTGDPNRVQEAGRSVEGGLSKLSAQQQPNSADAKITRASVTILTIDPAGTSLSDNDMKKVCLHEVGHALGLNGHSNDNHDVMFYSESPTVWPALSKRDRATISRLYAGYPPAAGSQAGY